MSVGWLDLMIGRIVGKGVHTLTKQRVLVHWLLVYSDGAECFKKGEIAFDYFQVH